MSSGRSRTKPGETSSDEPILFTPERRQQIMSLLEVEQRVTVPELSQQFAVSEVTIRKDLAWLEAQGLVRRTHGGAILSTPGASPGEMSIDVREQLQHAEKERIGEAAARYVQDGETIALDASTTALAMVPFLATKHDLTVATNGMRTAMELGHLPSLSVLLLGGMLRRETHSLVGKWGSPILTQINISKAFVGARGLTLHKGLTDVNAEEVELKRAIVEGAKEVIAVLDSTKWDLVTLTTFCPLERLKLIITDTQAPAHMVKLVRKLGVEVELV
ncbi:MAG: DeoR/GlpR transcriptional regulator [Ktedonobacteraceae bacterium]|nr:DeoR/GlpR transcriptional regulator [Ktedonobacteraceae bacterium]